MFRCARGVPFPGGWTRWNRRAWKLLSSPTGSSDWGWGRARDGGRWRWRCGGRTDVVRWLARWRTAEAVSNGAEGGGLPPHSQLNETLERPAECPVAARAEASAARGGGTRRRPHRSARAAAAPRRRPPRGVRRQRPRRPQARGAAIPWRGQGRRARARRQRATGCACADTARRERTPAWARGAGGRGRRARTRCERRASRRGAPPPIRAGAPGAAPTRARDA